MELHERDERRAAAEAVLGELAEAGVVGVVLPWVDTSGITRVKSVPLARLPGAAQWGVGMSPVFDGFLVDDSIVAGSYAGSAIGDLRLHPDLSRLTVLAGQPGWAWAPVDRYTQDGEPHVQCSRSLLRRLVGGYADEGLTLKAAVEVEWALGVGSLPEGADPDAFVPALAGPAYGMTRHVEVSDYARDLLQALADQGVAVDQFHPEYAAGQLEVSVAAQDPVAAADTALLVRHTITAVSMEHGLRASFSPKVTADGVGNGGHVHLSVWRDGQNLMSGGPGTFGLTAEGEAFTAGLLEHLPGLLAIGAPSVASYLRLVPSHWAGAFAVWGLENREAAVRFVTGPSGHRQAAANVEVKCVDGAANPYLLMAGLLAAGRAGMRAGATLPDPVGIDPGSLSEEGRREAGITALPASLEEAVRAFESDTELTGVFGTELATTIVEVRRGEIALFAGTSPEGVTRAVRWRY
ncbi:glutamine synthetase family protein [Modestobacter versicolor]|uniref:Glutamine synthetase n=1 Tax=Modestobacter versicolor TaxID=429133 RepID=A0A323VC59_9ACTN|nr:glutamine synthetase family protein [Modestobacter versicolor]MBB3674460.1 glutamine synthetase [Modestobacter versicolor]PZA20796.1 glutamine synthetase [Modestobacter versicolor]